MSPRRSKRNRSKKEAECVDEEAVQEPPPKIAKKKTTTKAAVLTSFPPKKEGNGTKARQPTKSSKSEKPKAAASQSDDEILEVPTPPKKDEEKAPKIEALLGLTKRNGRLGQSNGSKNPIGRQRAMYADKHKMGGRKWNGAFASPKRTTRAAAPASVGAPASDDDEAAGQSNGNQKNIGRQRTTNAPTAKNKEPAKEATTASLTPPKPPTGKSDAQSKVDKNNEPPKAAVESSMMPAAAAKVVIEAPPVEAYDSDAEPPAEDPKESLQWRGDPAVTLSDWRIEIVSHPVEDGRMGTTVVDTYHVHKIVLGFGARKSDYFVNLFCRGSRYSESSECTSRIELDPLAAAAFPQLLDYAYKTNGTEALDVKTETAAALHFLGQYFGMRRLRWEAKEFWKKDLKLENVTTYSHHARVFHDEKLLDGIANILVQRILEVTPSSKVVQESDAFLWRLVLEKLDGNALEGTVTHLSELIAEFAIGNLEELDAGTFELLTSPDKLPIVSHKTAFLLLEVEEKLSKPTGVENNASSLQTRCAEALASHWGEIESMPESDLALLNRRDPFLVAMITKSVANASKELKASKDAHDKSSNEHKKEVEKWESKHRYEKGQSKKYHGYWTNSYKAEDEAKASLRKTKRELKAAQEEIVSLRTAAAAAKASAEGTMINYSPQILIGKRLRVRSPSGKFNAGEVASYDKESSCHEVEYDQRKKETQKSQYKLLEEEVEWEDTEFQKLWSAALVPLYMSTKPPKEN